MATIPPNNKPMFWNDPQPSKTTDSDSSDAVRGLEAHRDAEKFALEREKLKRGLPLDDSYHVPRELIGRHLNTVQMRAIDWLWTGWIPKGYITIWAGETGAGKSTVLADVTAKVTTGAPWPGEHEPRQQGRVLWLGSEDGIEELTVPRLVACGANLANVTEIQGVVQLGKRNTFSMQDDLSAVKRWLADAQECDAPFDMLVIDPVTSYLPGHKLRKVDLNDAGQLRAVLEPWLLLAQEYSLAIVCVTHFMKDTTRAMLHRVLGSAAFTQTCRSLCSVIARPDDGMYAKALIQVKGNLPEHPGGAWKFRTVKVQVGIDPRNQKPIHATCPEWEQLDASLTPENLVGGTRGPISKYPAAFGLWLRAQFMTTPVNESQRVTDVKAAALAAGVVTARWWDEHSITYLEKQNFGGVWYCRLKNIPNETP
ncbi:AAA family ATPase [Propionivibrio sp.]|uniref:AAA family ATPase n=1 Tax=Propionivibrio sp. TaxID=2212460 RepID=UPI0039E22204